MVFDHGKEFFVEYLEFVFLFVLLVSCFAMSVECVVNDRCKCFLSSWYTSSNYLPDCLLLSVMGVSINGGTSLRSLSLKCSRCQLQYSVLRM